MAGAKSIDSILEQMLGWFEELGYIVLLQSDIVSGRHQAILQNCRYGILRDRFRQAMQRINPVASPPQIESVLDQLTPARPLPILQQNQQWHLQLLDGVQVKSTCDAHPPEALNLVDFANLSNNDWLVIHSFPVVETDYQHCLDLVVFINGLPLAVLHGLQGSGAAWSLRSTYLQLQSYQAHLPKFFALNELLILANGVQPRVGTLSSSCQQFMPIPVVNQRDVPESAKREFMQSIFDRQRFFEIIRHFIVFQQVRAKLVKKLRAQTFRSAAFP